MRIATLRDLYIEQLKDLHNAEKQISDGLRRFTDQAGSDELRSLLRRELEISGKQRERIEALFEGTDRRPTGEKCEAMEGLIKETESLVEMCETPEARDAALIAGLQRIKHYEIAGYGTARAFAEKLGENEAKNRLSEILEQESDEDDELTRLATGSINELAAEAVPA